MTPQRPIPPARARTLRVCARALRLAGVLACGFPLVSANRPGVLSDRNYYVRIAIARNARVIAFRPNCAYQVVNSKGVPVAALERGREYWMQVGKGAAAGRVYRLVVREVPPDRPEEAVALAKSAGAKYGLPGRALRQAVSTSGELNGLIVAIGEYKTLDAARAARDRLGDASIRQIFEERSPSTQAGVLLSTPGGAPIVSDNSLLRLTPEDVVNGALSLDEVEDRSLWSPRLLDKGRAYRGHMVIAVNERGSLTAVNHVWMEYYLYGVVAAEMGNDSPIEALKAQAVAARSEAVTKIERGMVSGDLSFDFTDGTAVQTYKGMGEESSLVRLAVDATRGEILVYDGRPVDAVYGHSCGGVISSSTDHWGTANAGYSRRMADRVNGRDVGDLSGSAAVSAWLQKGTDCFCNPNQDGYPRYSLDSFRWARKFSGEELRRKFDGGHGTGRVREIVIESRSPSGRVKRLRVVGERKSVTFDQEMEIRDAFGGLKSTFFALSPQGDGKGGMAALEIRGAGFGHGVGMCQMGAFMMARRNYGYRQILGFYFTGVKIRKLYA